MFSTTILIGRLGNDPEIKYTSSGDAVCSLSVATSDRWIDQSGLNQERTTWHKVVAWKKLAELCNQYLHKGRLVFIEGEIVNNSWEDKSGDKHYSTEIKARKILFLDSSNGSQKDNK